MNSVLKVNGVTQRFGGLVALENVNLDVRQGEIIGIIGPNGAGKTTLFNIITGIYTPTEGVVELLGKNITGLKPFKITALGFARTFQNIRLFGKMTVADNIILGMHTRTKTNIVDAIFQTPRKRKEEKHCEEKMVNILRILDLYEHKYDLASNLPYGSQRKLEIARALASDPKLLLLDEPAAGMNEQETDELMHIVKRLKEMGLTILLIEHDMKFVMNICERIYVFDHGVLIAQGTPREIKDDQAVIEAYLGKEA